MHNHLFVLSALMLLSILLTVIGLVNGLSGKRLIKNIILFSLALIPVVGLGMGTFYSHGFDIPWWLFGVVNSLAMVLSTSFTLVLFHLLNKNT